MHPHRAKAKAMHAAKIKGFATGGRVGSSDISEPKVKLMKGEEGKGYASGGMVMGMKAKHKAHKKPGTHINIINMPHGGAGAPPMGPPPMPGPGVGTIPPPVRPVAPAPMPGPMGMPPPGAGPMMRKNGGRVAFKKGGRVGKADGGDVGSMLDRGQAAKSVESNMRKAVNKIEDVDQKRGAMNKAMAKPLDDESSDYSGAIGNHTLDSDRKRGGKVAHKATGGRVKKADGGEVESENSSIATSSTPMLDKEIKYRTNARNAYDMAGNLNKAASTIKDQNKATGGRVSRPTATAKGSGPDKVSKSDPIAKPGTGKFKAGAGTGEGREEKIKAYGKNAGKAAKSSSTS